MKTTPFHTADGDIVFPWKPTSDRAFIFPSPPPETFIKGGTTVRDVVSSWLLVLVSMIEKGGGNPSFQSCFLGWK